MKTKDLSGDTVGNVCPPRLSEILDSKQFPELAKLHRNHHLFDFLMFLAENGYGITRVEAGHKREKLPAAIHNYMELDQKRLQAEVRQMKAARRRFQALAAAVQEKRNEGR